MYRSTFVIITLLATMSSGCAFKVCTLIGCESTLTMNFSSELPPDTYEVEFNSPDEGPCEVTLDSAAGQGKDCPGWGYVDLTPTALTIHAAIKSVSVRILRGGVLLGEGSFSPEYTTARPNGPDCEPLCETATVNLPLDGLATGEGDSASKSN